MEKVSQRRRLAFDQGSEGELSNCREKEKEACVGAKDEHTEVKRHGSPRRVIG